jgi:hypothetical protein
MPTNQLTPEQIKSVLSEEEWLDYSLIKKVVDNPNTYRAITIPRRESVKELYESLATACLALKACEEAIKPFTELECTALEVSEVNGQSIRITFDRKGLEPQSINKWNERIIALAALVERGNSHA